MYMIKQKIKKLYSHLNSLGLKKESSLLLKIALTTDEDLGAKADFSLLPEQQKKKIRENFSIYKTLSPEERTEAAHGLLDMVGLVPGPGDIADVINAVLYANEGKYLLAALSLICLVPAIGTAFGVAKKAGKAVPAKIIYENSKSIRIMIEKIAPQIPNGERVAAAVEKIISNIEIYGIESSINPITGEIISASRAIESGAKKIIRDGKVNKLIFEWYKNPKWLVWFKKIAEESLNPIINNITAEKAIERYIHIYKKELWFGISEESKLLDHYEARRLHEEAISRFIYDNFDKILENISKIKIKLSIDPKDLISEGINIEVRGVYKHYSNEIIIFLPSFSNLRSDVAMLKDHIVAVIDHEIWHAMDYNFKEFLDAAKNPNKKLIFNQSEYSLSDNLRANDYIKIKGLLGELNWTRFEDEYQLYLAEPTELFVRIRALRKFLENDLSANNLRAFADLDPKMVRMNSDVLTMWKLLQGVSDKSLKIISDDLDYFY